VGVRRFQDLVAWRLSHALKCEVLAFTATGPASRDFKFCDQIRDASASAPRNIAEGFGRFRPADFVRYLDYARGSLMETENHLIDAKDRGYLDEDLSSRLISLTRCALKATTNLLRSKQRQLSKQNQARTSFPRTLQR
jgi:four helix bundle protein